MGGLAGGSLSLSLSLSLAHSDTAVVILLLYNILRGSYLDVPGCFVIRRFLCAILFSFHIIVLCWSLGLFPYAVDLFSLCVCVCVVIFVVVVAV